MVFSSPIFLTAFLPLVLIAYCLCPKSWRNGVLLAASLTFYYWGTGRQTWILFVVVAVAYLGASAASKRSDRWSLGLVVAAVLSPLLWWKYSEFFSEIVSSVAGGVGADIGPLDPKILPVGISFFTFQALSYVLDVRRGVAKPLDRPQQFLLYIALFPQLIAGPIVRFTDIRDQLVERTHSASNLAIGATRFVHGLAKKVIVADSAALIADSAFNSNMERPTLVAWIGIIAYTVQIYFDFSGYSDMAIGLGKMFGFDFPENFKRPYSATSISDFWRRWHITLSTWFRDYVYIPLGGSRVPRIVEYRNLLIIFFLTALWHGAAFTFLVWGGIHGFWLIVERALGWNDSERVGWFRRPITLLIVMITWVFFRAASIADATDYIADLFTYSNAIADPRFVSALTVPNVAMLLVGVASFLLPGSWVAGLRLAPPQGVDDRPVFRLVYLAVMTPLCLVFVASSEYSPFIYFQF